MDYGVTVCAELSRFTKTIGPTAGSADVVVVIDLAAMAQITQVAGLRGTRNVPKEGTARVALIFRFLLSLVNRCK